MSILCCIFILFLLKECQNRSIQETKIYDLIPSQLRILNSEIEIDYHGQTSNNMDATATEIYEKEINRIADEMTVHTESETEAENSEELFINFDKLYNDIDSMNLNHTQSEKLKEFKEKVFEEAKLARNSRKCKTLKHTFHILEGPFLYNNNSYQRKNSIFRNQHGDNGTTIFEFDCNSTHFEILMIMYDGRYDDNTIIAHNLSLLETLPEDYEKLTLNFSIKDIDFLILTKQNYKIRNQNNCLTNMTLLNILKEDRKPHFALAISSDQGRFDINVELSYIDYKRYKTIIWAYSALVFGINLIAISFSFKELSTVFRESDTYGRKLSIVSLSWNMLWNSFLFFAHIAKIIDYKLYMELSGPIISLFVLFGILQLHFILVLWKARNTQLFLSGEREIRSGLQRFQFKLYMFLICGMMTITSVVIENQIILVVFIGLLWVPQIYTNIQTSNRSIPSFKYLVAISVQQLSVPLYFNCYKYNMLKRRPDYTACIYMSGMLICSLIILIFQRILGPRFFIPLRCRPNSYQYIHKVMEKADIELDAIHLGECAICLSPICYDVDDSQNVITSPDGGNTTNYNYMKTPCNHNFHISCLSTWMVQKLECPTCRHPLPPLNDDAYF